MSLFALRRQRLVLEVFLSVISSMFSHYFLAFLKHTYIYFKISQRQKVGAFETPSLGELRSRLAAADAAEVGAPGAEAAGAGAELAAARRGWAARFAAGMEAAIMLRWMWEPHRTRLRTLLLLCLMVGFMLLFSLLMPRVTSLPQ